MGGACSSKLEVFTPSRKKPESSNGRTKKLSKDAAKSSADIQTETQITESPLKAIPDVEFPAGPLGDLPPEGYLRRCVEDKVVRVFVSSTFIDFGPDRDALTRFTFPKLQHLCRSRGMFFVAVDLRWGITAEESASAKVIELCLLEMERSRPYFISLLGQRYGWHQRPNSSQDPLLHQNFVNASALVPWVMKFSDRSVTEIEILYSAIHRQHRDYDRTFFYLRHPSASVSPDGVTPYHESDPASSAKLADLKNVIRSTRYKVKDGYSTPKQLCDEVYEDLKAAICRDFPLSSASPDPLQQERDGHMRFAEARRWMYVRRAAEEELLSQLLTSDEARAVCVAGDYGTGKSALLAAFAATWASRDDKDRGKTLVITHFVGGTNGPATPEGVVRRLFSEVQSHTEVLPGFEPRDVDSMSDLDVLREFENLLAGYQATPETSKPSPTGPKPAQIGSNATQPHPLLLIIVDGVDRLCPSLPRALFNCVPMKLPSNIRLVFSASTEPCIEEMKSRGWSLLRIGPLNRQEASEVVTQYLRRYGKRLPTATIEATLATTAAMNPLFLRLLLDELRIFGVHELIEQHARSYLELKDAKQLYSKILERWEAEHGRALVSETLGLISVSRSGLAEAELLEILKPTPVAWSPFFLAIRDSLISRLGCLHLPHDPLIQAVRERYISSDSDLLALQRRLATYFQTQPGAERRSAELPWLLHSLQDWPALLATLSDLHVFKLLWSSPAKYDVLRFWRDVTAATGADPARELLAAIRGWERAHRQPGLEPDSPSRSESESERPSSVLLPVGSFLLDLGRMADALWVLERPGAVTPSAKGFIVSRKGATGGDLSPIKNGTIMAEEAANALLLRSDILARLGDSVRSLSLAEEALTTLRAAQGVAVGPAQTRLRLRVTGCMSQIAGLMHHTGREEEALQMCREVLKELKVSLEKPDPRTESVEVARVFSTMATILHHHQKEDEALTLLDRAMSALQWRLGPSHPEVSVCANAAANLHLRAGRYDEAMRRYKHAMSVQEATYGPDHPNVATALVNLANCHAARGDADEAATLYPQALSLQERAIGTSHPAVARTLVNWAKLEVSRGGHDEAIALYERALLVVRDAFGPSHPDLAQTMLELADTYWQSGRPSDAERLAVDALRLREVGVGVGVGTSSEWGVASHVHPDVGTASLVLARVRDAEGALEEALRLETRAVEVLEGCEHHPEYCRTLIGTDADAVIRLGWGLATAFSAQCETLLKLGRAEEAVRSGSRALALHRQGRGLGRSRIRSPGQAAVLAAILNNVGSAMKLAGQLDQARSMYRQAIAQLQGEATADGPDGTPYLSPSLDPDGTRQVGQSVNDPYLVVVLTNLAELHRSSGELSLAEATYRRLLTLLEKGVTAPGDNGNRDTETGAVPAGAEDIQGWSQGGSSDEAQGRSQSQSEGRPQGRREGQHVPRGPGVGLGRSQSRSGDTARLVEALCRLGGVLEEAGRHEEAYGTYQRALGLMGPADAPEGDVTGCLMYMANVLVKMRRTEEAVEVFQRARALQTALEPAARPMGTGDGPDLDATAAHQNDGAVPVATAATPRDRDLARSKIRTLSSLATALEELGNLHTAADALESALALWDEGDVVSSGPSTALEGLPARSNSSSPIPLGFGVGVAADVDRREDRVGLLVRLASIRSALGEHGHDACRDVLLKALKHLRLLTQPTPGLLRLYLDVSLTYREIGDVHAATEAIHSALQVFSEGRPDVSPSDRAALCISLAGLHGHQGSYDDAVLWYKTALDVQGLPPELRDAALRGLGAVYSSQGLLDDAIRSYALVQSEDEELAAHLDALARQLAGFNRPADAIPLALRSLATLERDKTPSQTQGVPAAPRDVTPSLELVAALHQACNEHEKALCYLEKVTAARIGSLGLEHVEVGRSIVALAGAHLALRRYDQAAVLYRQALQTFEHAGGMSQRDVTTVTDGDVTPVGVSTEDMGRVRAMLASTLCAEGQWEEGALAYSKAREALGDLLPLLLGQAEAERQCGRPNVSLALYSVAARPYVTSDDSRDQSGAEGMSRARSPTRRAEASHTVERGVRTKMPEHPQRPSMLESVSETEPEPGSESESEAYQSQQARGSLYRCLDSLSYGFVRSGDLASAAASYGLAVAVLPPGDLRVPTALSNLGVVEKNLGKAEEAMRTFQRALALLDEQRMGRQVRRGGGEREGVGHEGFGVEVTNNVNVLHSIGDVLPKEEQRQLELAELSQLSQLLANLAGVQAVQGRLEEAAESYKRSLEARQKVVGDVHPDVAGLVANLATILASLGRHTESLPLFEKALQVRDAAGGEVDVLWKVSILENMGKLYRLLGNEDQAEAMFHSAQELQEA